MKFIIIIICLVLTHYLKLQTKLSNYNPLNFLYRWLQPKLHASRQAWLMLASLVLPYTLLSLLISLLLRHQGHGLGNFLFANLILLYCFSSAPALTLIHPSHIKLDKKSLLLIWQFLLQFFAPLFWFAVFGNFGIVAALSYRLISLAQATTQHETTALATIALRCHGVALWLPGRVLGLIFALLAPQHGAALKNCITHLAPRGEPGIRYNALYDTMHFLAICVQTYLSQHAHTDVDDAIPLTTKLIKHSLITAIIIVAISNVLSLVI